MRRPDRTFSTAAEAAAFLEGIEFVNDSAITACIASDDACTVVIEDEDYEGGDEDEE